MSGGDFALIFAAALAAGTVNTLAGAGSLLTFPVLLAVGVPPVTANISNTLGLVWAGLFGAFGYRRELRRQTHRLRALIPVTTLGATLGAVLLLSFPAAFIDIVPVMVIIAVIAIALAPIIQSAAHRRISTHSPRQLPEHLRWAQLGVGLVGIYGGYFGAAQGVLLMAVLGLSLVDQLQRLNAQKNVLATTANVVSAIIFLVFAGDRIDWRIVGLIAVGGAVGGWLGARIGRRLPARWLRAVILFIGLAAAVFTAWQ